MTKADIITAAFRVWGRELYQSTSLTQLARDLGVTKPALYRHFPHKQALLDGMFEWFFDDCAAFIKADYDKAAAADDPAEGLLILGKAVARYYCLNMNAFIFSILRVYGGRNHTAMAEELAKRGVDMGKLHFSNYPYCPGMGGDAPHPSLMHLVIVTLMFWVGFFHKYRLNADPERGIRNMEETTVSNAVVSETIVSMEEKILNGLGFNKDRVDRLNYQELEGRIAGLVPGNIEDDGLYRAVAEAVAEAGPWEVSMEMVARRSGLSKSGLYAHFKNKQDMIRQFFWTEYERILASANMGKAQSAAPEEQLYLTIIAIADYLRSHPEILFAFDRIRTRKLDLEFPDPDPLQFYQVFEGIDIEALGADYSRTGVDALETRERISQWILFLIVNILMWGHEERQPGGSGEPKTGEGPACRSRLRGGGGVYNSSFRILYRFIALGIRGFEGNNVSANAVSEREGVDL
ncbi:MAG: TetR/AcrR family transcriptional regulator [Treponema sp.]|jgi:AcrR family transcriptional regulator|nr:TetR/AcrR family transcriptional regulator [Treponema sp.]